MSGNMRFSNRVAERERGKMSMNRRALHKQQSDAMCCNHRAVRYTLSVMARVCSCREGKMRLKMARKSIRPQ